MSKGTCVHQLVRGKAYQSIAILKNLKDVAMVY